MLLVFKFDRFGQSIVQRPDDKRNLQSGRMSHFQVAEQSHNHLGFEIEYATSDDRCDHESQYQAIMSLKPPKIRYADIR